MTAVCHIDDLMWDSSFVCACSYIFYTEAEYDDEYDEDDDDDDYYYYYVDDDDEEEDPAFPPVHEPEGAMVETELLTSLVTVIRQEGIEQPIRLLITVS